MSIRFKDLPEELTRPSNVYGVWAVVSVLGWLLVLVIAIPIAVTQLSPWMLLILIPLLGGALHKVLHLIHECSHDTLFTRTAANRFVGQLSSLLVLLRFDAFVDLHMEHHRRQGEATDPQVVDYDISASESRLVVAWRLFQPLFGLSLFKVFQFNNLSAGTSAEEPGVGRGSTERTRAFVPRGIALLLVHVPIVYIVSAGGEVIWLIPAYHLTGITFGAFFTRVRSFVEHVSPTRPNVPYVRSHRFNPFDWFFFFSLNFNCHAEHHRFPQVPAVHLPRICVILGEDESFQAGHSSSVMATLWNWFRENAQPPATQPQIQTP